jgi:hypothetical protein
VAIGIQGVRLEHLRIEFGDTQDYKLTGDYALMSTKGKVLARQGFNGYGGIEIKPSASTVGLMNKLVEAFNGDLNSVLGLNEENAS